MVILPLIFLQQICKLPLCWACAGSGYRAAQDTVPTCKAGERAAHIIVYIWLDTDRLAQPGMLILQPDKKSSVYLKICLSGTFHSSFSPLKHQSVLQGFENNYVTCVFSQFLHPLRLT